MRGGVFSKNIWEGASERRNENIIVSGTLKTLLQIFGNYLRTLLQHSYLVKLT